MIKLTLDVWDSKSKQAMVFDNLMSGIPFLDAHMRHFAYSCGLGHVYEKGALDAEQCMGKGGRCLIRNKEQTGYKPKNEVADYLVSDQTKATPNYQESKANGMGAAAAKTAMQESWTKFQGQNTGFEADLVATKWREAIAASFPGKQKSDIGAAEWRSFTARSFKPIKPEFDEVAVPDDDIPF